MKKLLFTISTALLLSACGEATDEGTEKRPAANKLQQLSWLQGNWQMETPDGTLMESWETAGENEWKGTGMFVTANGDTPFTEKIRLVQEDSVLWYLPAVSNQNEGKEVRFKEKSLSENKVVFENTAHDFPQRIIYTKTGDNTVDAKIEGTKDGQEAAETYNFHRR